MPSSVAGRGPPAGAPAAAPAAARRPARVLVLVLDLGALGGAARLLLGPACLLLGARGLGGLELGGDQGVVLGAQVDLVVEVLPGAPAATRPGTRSLSCLNAWICWTVTSSLWAIHASVRPSRTHERIWLSCGRSERRAIAVAEPIGRVGAPRLREAREPLLAGRQWTRHGGGSPQCLC